MELIAILFVIAIWDVSKSAVRNARQDYRREAGPKPKAKSGKGSGRDPDAAARAHRARGWWLRELGSGFAVTRTGWHTGWHAHRAEADRAQLEREEARTLHAETRTGVQRHVAAFRQRHAEATRALEEQLEKQRQAGDQATGKSAVQSAADEVSRKRNEREQGAGPRCPGCNAPEGYDHRPDCDPTVPPLPASGVRTAADHPRSTMFPGMRPRETASPEVIDTPVRVHNADDSDWLRPGESRCEGCGGSGRHPDGRPDACPVCRGWGGAPADPDGPQAAPGTICRACGRPGTREDPVVQALGGEIHRSHALARQESYDTALATLRRTQDTGAAPDEGADPALPDGPAVTLTPTGSGGIALVPERQANPSPTTQGAPVTDTNYTAVLANAKTAADQAEQAAVVATRDRVAAEQHAEGMQAADVKGNCLSAQMELVDLHKAQEDAAKKVGEQAQVVSSHLQREHGGIQAAVDDAPIPEPAQPGFYAGS